MIRTKLTGGSEGGRAGTKLKKENKFKSAYNIYFIILDYAIWDFSQKYI